MDGRPRPGNWVYRPARYFNEIELCMSDRPRSPTTRAAAQRCHGRRMPSVIPISFDRIAGPAGQAKGRMSSKEFVLLSSRHAPLRNRGGRISTLNFCRRSDHARRARSLDQGGCELVVVTAESREAQACIERTGAWTYRRHVDVVDTIGSVDSFQASLCWFACAPSGRIGRQALAQTILTSLTGAGVGSKRAAFTCGRSAPSCRR